MGLRHLDDAGNPMMTTTTTIAVPTSCAALCTKLAELVQRIDDQLAQAVSGAAIDYGALEQRVADALGDVERGLHAQVLARLDINVPAIRVWGDEYRRIGDEQNQGDEPKAARDFRMAHVATVTLRRRGRSSRIARALSHPPHHPSRW